MSLLDESKHGGGAYRAVPGVISMGASAGATMGEPSVVTAEGKPITVGVLGGGQLGRMMGYAAHKMGIKLIILDDLGDASPAGQVSHGAITGSFKDEAKIKELAAVCDAITVEIEHIDCSGLEAVAKEGKPVDPSPQTLRLIQDKLAQKRYLKEHTQVPMPEFLDAPDTESVRQAGAQWGYPMMLKARLGAYDGRGNAVVKSEEGIDAAFSSLGGKDLYLERWAPFTKELAVMVARNSTSTAVYPVVETVQRHSQCHTVIAPAEIPAEAQVLARDVARQAIEVLPGGKGIFGVELFLLPDGSVLFNEIAPRPHNSGHYTMEACYTEQFEMHLRAILDWPLGDPSLKVPVAGMLNIIGSDDSQMATTMLPIQRTLTIPGSTVHWYGKASAKPRRKMGHINYVCSSHADLHNAIAVCSGEPADRKPQALVGVIMGSDSDLGTMKAAAEVLEKFEVPYELTIVSAHRTPQRLCDYARSAASRGLRTIIAGAGGAAHLPGMVAAMTPLPVIGVPVKTSTLNGNDSLLSIVQMPRGVPVATVAIGNAMNAGLLAVRMLGMSSPRLLDKMSKFMDEQEEEVLEKAGRIEEGGWKSYLAEKGGTTSVNV